jgi:hypothetical protein
MALELEVKQLEFRRHTDAVRLLNLFNRSKDLTGGVSHQGDKWM